MVAALAVTAAVGASLAWFGAPAPAPAPDPSAGAQASEPELLASVTSSSTGVTPTAKSASAGTVIVNLTALPSSARVTLDGASIASSFSGEFRAGTALHHLEVTAPGHRPYKRLIAFEKNHVLRIVLEPLQTRSVARRGSSARGSQAEQQDSPIAEAAPSPSEPQPTATAANAPGQDLTIASPRQKRRALDLSDPYASQ